MRLGRAAGATAIGYLVGTFPTADLVAKRVSGGRIDLRATGSGNPGGVNALKVLGKKAGYTVMAVDIAKGAAASAIGAVVAGPTRGPCRRVGVGDRSLPAAVERVQGWQGCRSP